MGWRRPDGSEHIRCGIGLLGLVCDIRHMFFVMGHFALVAKSSGAYACLKSRQLGVFFKMHPMTQRRKGESNP